MTRTYSPISTSRVVITAIQDAVSEPVLAVVKTSSPAAFLRKQW